MCDLTPSRGNLHISTDDLLVLREHFLRHERYVVMAEVDGSDAEAVRQQSVGLVLQFLQVVVTKVQGLESYHAQEGSWKTIQSNKKNATNIIGLNMQKKYYLGECRRCCCGTSQG